MSMLQTTAENSPSGNLNCPRCRAVLPPHAIFCSSCGERVGKAKKQKPEEGDASRYRITSLVRRRPYVKLFFAVDSEHERLVAIRNIDISGLDEEAQARAAELARSEYDLLRRQGIVHVMPVIDLQGAHEQILTVAGQPFLERGKTNQESRLYTLQEVLQSGIGLPDQEVALDWIKQICRSVESLHAHRITIGDLDPYAIILNGATYQSQPALMVSWLPPQLRALFPRITTRPTDLSPSGALATSYSAPEVLLGRVERTSDVYSLGAILYLLLTGKPPDQLITRTQRRLRSPRELNPYVSSRVDEVVMRALALEQAQRFASVEELEKALSRRTISQTLKTPAVPARPMRNGNGNDVLLVDRIANMDTINITPLPEVGRALEEAARAQEQAAETQMHRSTTDHAQGEVEPVRRGAINGAQKEATLVEGKIEVEQEAVEHGTAPVEETETEPQVVEKEAAVAEEIQAEQEPVEGRVAAVEEQAPTVKAVEIEQEPVAEVAREQLLGVSSPASNIDEIPTTTFTGPSISERLRQQVSGVLPVIPQLSKRITGVLPPIPRTAGEASSLLKQIRRMVVGQQMRATTAAAIIENPLRVQPGQSYNIRIRLMGRDKPALTERGTQVGGLSGCAHENLVYVEVRSPLHQYAYIVQQAAVKIPAGGYAAEVLMPMQPFSHKSDGRRERLHVFFLDELRRPLYEKPFVVQIFVSHLVQPGREGQHALPIPH